MMKISILFLSFFIVLAGCDASGLKAAYQLRNVDPMSTDVAGLRVAVDVPALFRPNDKEISVVGTLDQKGQPQTNMRIHLIPAPETSKEQALRANLGANRSLFVYYLDPGDQAEFEAFRALVASTKDGDATVSGSLGVDSPVCRTSKTLPEELRVTVHLKVADLNDYVTIVNNVDVLEDLDTQEAQSEVPMCS